MISVGSSSLSCNVVAVRINDRAAHRLEAPVSLLPEEIVSRFKINIVECNVAEMDGENFVTGPGITNLGSSL